MKKTYFLKTLFVAACLLVGVNASWAETKNLYSQNFDGESAVPTNWTQANGSLSLQVDNTNKWLRESTSGSGSRLAWYKGSDIKNAIGEYTAYTLEFDCNINEGTNTGNYSQGVWVLGNDLANSWGTPTSPIIGVQKGSNQTVYTVYANLAATETTVNLASNTWYHYVCAYNQTTKKLTFSILSQDKNQTILAATEFDYDYETAKGVFASIAFQAGRNRATSSTSGYTEIDNILLTTEIEGDVANDPTITETAVNGENREYSISFSDGETLHYTVPGGIEQTATVSPVNLTITSAGTLSAYTTKGTATSSTIEVTVTHGAITLNAPTYTISFAESDGVYHPTYNFASNQDDKENHPTATISYVLNGGESTTANSLTPASTGTLTITASAEGYTSASTVVTVSNVNFFKTYSFDATTIVKSDGAGTDGGNTTIGGTGCAFYTLADCTYDLRNDITLSDLSFAWAITANVAKGLAPRVKDGTIGFALNEGELIEFVGQNVVLDASKNSYTVPRLTLVSSINIYTPSNFTVSKSISAAGYATFCSPYALDFSTTGLTAYIATATADKVSFSEVSSVPANTGVLLKGDAGTYNIPVVASSAKDVSDNVFEGVTEATEIAAKTGFVLMASPKVGFYKNKNAFTVGANTAYIPVANIPNEGRSFIGFDDETTGISSLNLSPKSEGSIYNLNGQRVQKAQKGLYIQGGKKFVVK